MSGLVKYLSPSAFTAYLSNPMYFKKRYIMGVYDTQSSVTGVIGRAGHKALERIYSGMSVDDAIIEGQKIIDNTSDAEIKYGSQVPDRSKLLSAYTRAINFYVDELPQYHKIISIEELIKVEAESKVHKGTNLPLPLALRLDMLTANQLKELEIVDHKFVYAYTDPDKDDFKRWIQAMFYFYGVGARYGIAPARMRFKECKTSGNKDGSPQIKEWVYEYNNPNDFVVFERLFTDVILDMNNPGRLFLPNPGDNFNGQDMFELYRQDVMPVAAPVAVKHRTEEVDFVEKEFIASAGNSADTTEYTPEERLRKKLQEFGIPVQMKETLVGPGVIKYTMQPSRGVKMTKIISHTKDIALALAAESVRVEAPIPGTSLVGVEIPNLNRTKVDLEEKHFRPGTMNIPIGVDVVGNVVHKDLSHMPHLIIAGQTGSGKSVMLNVILQSLTKQLSPKELQLVLVDPKQVELTAYDKDPHLFKPVVTDTITAAQTLDEMVKLMEERYSELREASVRNIDDFLAKGGAMSKIVVVIDEFADLMMMSEGSKAESLTTNIQLFNEQVNMVAAQRLDAGMKKLMTQKDLMEIMRGVMEQGTPDVEHSIIRLAQKARAVGIHLVLATQRPSAEVVTGRIKANIPAKIAFTASNEINSRIILDESGAEKLTGKGDMLYRDPSEPGLRRLQGFFC